MDENLVKFEEVEGGLCNVMMTTMLSSQSMDAETLVCHSQDSRCLLQFGLEITGSSGACVVKFNVC